MKYKLRIFTLFLLTLVTLAFAFYGIYKDDKDLSLNLPLNSKSSPVNDIDRLRHALVNERLEKEPSNRKKKELERCKEKYLDNAILLKRSKSKINEEDQFEVVKNYKTKTLKYNLRIVELWKLNEFSKAKLINKLVMVSDHFTVRIKKGTDFDALNLKLKQHGARIRKKLKTKNTFLVAFDSEKNDFNGIKETLTNLSEFESVDSDYLVTTSLSPNDPEYGDLWGLNNTGQEGGVVDADIDAPEAWDITQGDSSVVVGVIDTGIDYSHVDLSDNIWINTGEIAGNGVDDDSNGYIDDVRGWDFSNDDNDPMDDHGHGTHVAGTIGAVGDNSEGVIGVCPNVKLLALKFLNQDGSGFTSDALEAITYVNSLKINKGTNIRMTNNSWGGGGYSQSMYEAINESMMEEILFVAASGNDGYSTANYPAHYNLINVISVAATDRYDELAWFSNFSNNTVDLAAPGVNILSTIPGNAYASFSGTSMATPHVSGALSLVFSQNPSMTVIDARNRLLERVDLLLTLETKVASRGRLNVFNLIDEAWVTSPAEFALRSVDFIDSLDKGKEANLGEMVSINPILGNTGSSEATNVSIQVVSQHSGLTVVGETTYNFGSVAKWTDIQPSVPFQIQISPTVKNREKIYLDFIVNFDGGSQQVFSYSFHAFYYPEAGDIHGTKFEDLNNNGSWDEGEPALSGWTIFIDENRNGILDSGEQQTITNAFGEYLFSNLPTGSYSLREVEPSGWLTSGSRTHNGASGNIYVNMRSRVVEVQADGTYVKDIELPDYVVSSVSPHNYLHNFVMDNQERLVAYYDKHGPAILTYDINTGVWAENLLQGLTLNQRSRVTIFDKYLFLANDAINGAWDSGFVRVDLENFSWVKITPSPLSNPLEFRDLQIGIDGLLYCLEDLLGANRVHVYDPVTLNKLRVVELEPESQVQGSSVYLKTIAINRNGDFYGAELVSGHLFHMNSEGEHLRVYDFFSGSPGDLTLSADGQLVFSRKDWEETIVLDESFLNRTTIDTSPYRVHPLSNADAYNFVFKDVVFQNQNVVYLHEGIANLDFGSIQTTSIGSIAGNVWEDLNDNGIRDSNETGKSGQRVFIDDNRNSKHDNNETTALTDGMGNFTFTGLYPGNYRILFKENDDWASNSHPEYYEVNLGTQENKNGYEFGVKNMDRIIFGNLFNDLNNNKVKDAGETALMSWTVYLDLDNNGQKNSGEPSTLTDASGYYEFENVSYQNYTVAIDKPTNWQVTNFTGSLPLSGNFYKTAQKIDGWDTGKILEVDMNFNVVNETDIPFLIDDQWQNESIKDLVVDPAGNMHIYQGDENVTLSTYNFSQDTWSYTDFPGSTTPLLSKDGIGRYDNYIYLSMVGQKGIFRIDTKTGLYQKFHDDLGFSDISIGLNGKLYALRGTVNSDSSEIYCFDPITMQVENIINLVETVDGIDVNQHGTIFAISWHGEVYRFDANGSKQALLVANIGNLYDIDVSADGQIIVTGQSESLITDNLFENVKSGIIYDSVVSGLSTWKTLTPNETFTTVITKEYFSQEINFGLREMTWGEISGILTTSGSGIFLEGVTVFLDENDNGILDEGELSTLTNLLGQYYFEEVPPGTYKVVVESRRGWSTSTVISEIIVTTGSKDTVDIIQQMVSEAEIKGVAFDDLNSNGVKDTGEIGIAGMTMYLDLNNNAVWDVGEPTQVTDTGGNYIFGTLSEGVHLVRQMPRSGWENIVNANSQLMSGNIWALVDDDRKINGYWHAHALHEYEMDGSSTLNVIPIPDGYNVDADNDSPREVLAGNFGEIHVMNGTSSPELSTYFPETTSWNHEEFPFWDFNAFTYHGGMDTYKQYVFAADYGVSGTYDPQINGVIRFDLHTKEKSRVITGFNSYGLVVGVDNLLYVLEEKYTRSTFFYSLVRVYDPETLQLIRIVDLGIGATSIAVDINGNIFAADTDGVLYKFNPLGAALNEMGTGMSRINNIELSVDGKILLSGRQYFAITDENMYSIEKHAVTASNLNTYAAFKERSRYGSNAVYLKSGDIVQNINFASRKIDIGGMVWYDSDQNGVADGGEVRLKNRKVYIDDNNNDIWDNGEMFVLTDELGFYFFNQLPDAIYNVKLEDVFGWSTVIPVSNNYMIDLTQGDKVDANFSLTKLNISEIKGIVFEDLNFNGQVDLGEGPLSNAKVFLDQNSNGIHDGVEQSVLTGASGEYVFENLPEDQYEVVIEAAGGYKQTFPLPLATGNILVVRGGGENIKEYALDGTYVADLPHIWGGEMVVDFLGRYHTLGHSIGFFGAVHTYEPDFSKRFSYEIDLWRFGGKDLDSADIYKNYMFLNGLQEIIRVDLNDYSSTVFSNDNVKGVSMGLDGLLYSASDNRIHVYDPETMEDLSWFDVPPYDTFSAVAVNSSGDIFIGTHTTIYGDDSMLLKVNKNGGIIASVDLDNSKYGYVTDLDLSPDGTLVIASTYYVGIFDENLNFINEIQVAPFPTGRTYTTFKELNYSQPHLVDLSTASIVSDIDFGLKNPNKNTRYLVDVINYDTSGIGTSSEGSRIVNEGDSKSFTIIPTGSSAKIAYVKLDGVDFQIDNPFVPFTVDVTNVNQNHLIEFDFGTNYFPNIDSQEYEVLEATANGTVIGQVLATDPDGDSLQFSIRGETSVFDIDPVSGNIFVVDETNLVYLQTQSYTLTVEVNDGQLVNAAVVNINILPRTTNVHMDLNQSTLLDYGNYEPSLGQAQIINGGTTLHQSGIVEATAIAFPYTVTDKTYIEFSFSGEEGDIHGIGFDNDLDSGDIASRLLKVAGSGNMGFDIVSSFGGVNSKKYVINIGSYYQGTFQYLFFYTQGDSNTESLFENIKVYEAPDIPPTTATNPITTGFPEDSYNMISPRVANLSSFFTDPDSPITSYEIISNSNPTLIGASINGSNMSYYSYSNLNGVAELIVRAHSNALFADLIFIVTVSPVNDWPIIDNSGATFIIEEFSPNGTVVGKVLAHDVDDDALNFYISGGTGQNAFAVDSSTGVITVINSSLLDYDVVEQFDLVIRAGDGSVVRQSTFFIDLSSAPNTVPTINNQQFAVDENTENVSFVGTVVASDADNDLLTYSVTGGTGAQAFTVNLSTGEIRVLDKRFLNYEITQSYTLNVEVSDGEDVNGAVITVNLNNVSNESIDIYGVPDASVDFNELYTFVPVATDAENDPLTFSIVNKPTWASFDTLTGTLSGTPVESNVGTTANIIVSVSDGQNTASLPPFNLMVRGVNQVPVISGIPLTTVNEDAAYSFTPTASDGNGDTLTFSIVNQPMWSNFNTLTGELSGTPGFSDVGTTSNIVISVSDGMASVSLPSFSLTVMDVNEVPVIASVGTTAPEYTLTTKFRTNHTQSVNRNDFSIDMVNATDIFGLSVDSGESHTTVFRLNGIVIETIGFEIVQGTWYLLEFTNSATGSEMRIWEDGATRPAFPLLSSTIVFPTPTKLTLSGANYDAPEVSVDYLYIDTPSIRWLESDFDGDYSETFDDNTLRDLGDNWTGMRHNGDHGGNTAPYATLTGGIINYRGGQGNASDYALIERLLEAPIVQSSTIYVGESYQYTPTASDADGDPLTFSIVNMPTWASFNTLTGELSGTPSAIDVGTTSGIVISVSDGMASVSLPPFSLTVMHVNEVPVITPVGEYTLTTKFRTNHAQSVNRNDFSIDMVNATDIFGLSVDSGESHSTVFRLNGIVIETTSFEIVRGTWYLLEFTSSATGSEMRIWEDGATRPASSLLSSTIVFPTPTKLTLSGANYDAPEVSVDYLYIDIPYMRWLESDFDGYYSATFDDDTLHDLGDNWTGTRHNGDHGSYTVPYAVLTGGIINYRGGQGNGSDYALIERWLEAPIVQSNTIYVGESYQYTPTASDADGDPLTFSIVNMPTWASFNTLTGELSGSPSAIDVGTTSGIVISVSDGKYSASLPPFDINVLPLITNTAPVITGIPSTTVNSGEAYSFIPFASDVDGDTLTFNIVNMPVWGSFNTLTGELSGTPVASEEGSYPNIIISVSDGVLTTALPAFSITVESTQINLPESDLNYSAVNDTDGNNIWESGGVDITANWTLDAGVARTVISDSSFANITHAYHFDGSSGGTMRSFNELSPDASTSAATFEFWIRPTNVVGDHVLFETGGGKYGTTMLVNASGVSMVVKSNLVSATVSSTTLSTAEFSHVVGVYDKDNGGNGIPDVYLYVNGILADSVMDVSGLSDWAGGNDSGLGIVNSKSNESVTHNFEGDMYQFNFYRSALSASEVSDLFESENGGTPPPSNQAPTIAGTPLTVISIGQFYSFIPTANDVNGDTLTFSVQNNPDWLTLNTNTGELSGIPNLTDVGTTIGIVLSVSDGQAITNLPAFDLTVEIEFVNTAPSIGGIPLASIEAGSLYDFTPDSHDIDGDVLAFSVVNKPSWASFDTGTGQLSGTPESVDNGSYLNITISVTDGLLTTNLPSFDLTVQISAPVISGSPSLVAPVGALYSFAPSVSDVNGDVLTFSVVGLPVWANFNSSTGELSGTPLASEVGDYLDIVISVTDGIFVTDLPSFDLQVYENVETFNDLVFSGDFNGTHNQTYTDVDTPYDLVDGWKGITGGDNGGVKPYSSIANGILTYRGGTGNFSDTLRIFKEVNGLGSEYRIIMKFKANGPASNSGRGEFNFELSDDTDVFLIRLDTDASHSSQLYFNGILYQSGTFQIDRGIWYQLEILNTFFGSEIRIWQDGESKPVSTVFSDTSWFIPNKLTLVGWNYDAPEVSVDSIEVFEEEEVNPPPSNQAPTISGTPLTAIATDQFYSFIPTASDVDGDILTFSIANEPVWGNFNTQTGELSGTPVASEEGSYPNIIISVDDGVLSTALPPFSITVGTTSITLPEPDLNYSAVNDTDGNNIWENGGTDITANWALGAGVIRSAISDSSLADISYAYHFDGSSGGKMKTFQELSPPADKDSASFEFWIRPTNVVGTHVLFETGGGSGSSVVVKASGVSMFMKDKLGGGSVTVSSSTLSTTEFSHVVGVYDKDSTGNGIADVYLYVNGVLVDSALDVSGLNDWSGGNDSGLGIVNSKVNQSVTHNFEGDIYAFNFYRSALPESDVINLYNTVK